MGDCIPLTFAKKGQGHFKVKSSQYQGHIRKIWSLSTLINIGMICVLRGWNREIFLPPKI